MTSSIAAATVPHSVAFDSGHKSAATVIFVFALLSTLVLSIVLLGVVWVVSFVALKRTVSEKLSREVFFFRSQLGQYACSLLLSKWISCLGGLIAIKWANEGGITTGPSCSTQGVFYEVGEFASSFFVVVMGLHTFNTLVLRNRQPQWVGPVVTVLGWAAAFAVGTGPLIMSDRAGGPLYNMGSLSCGFSRSSPVTHIFLFFIPMFLGSLLSAIVYSLIFLILRGTITINGGLRFQLDPECRLRLRNVTFEEYQRFVYSVARTMLWLPITFGLVLFPSTVVQSMEASGVPVPTGPMAFSYILIYLDGIFDVLILFYVLRVLGRAVKSPTSTVSSDPEKGQSKRGPVSRPTYDWNPQSTFASPSQAQIMRTAPPAHPPSTILQGSVARTPFLGRSLFQPRKKTGSMDSSTRLLTPEPLSRSHSPSPSLSASEVSVVTTVLQKPMVPASVLDAKPSLPPPVIQRHTETGPLQLLTADPPQNGFTPYSPPRLSRIYGGLSPIPGSPSIPQSAAQFQDVTLHSPAVSRPPTTDGIGALVSLYFSRKSTESLDLPPLPSPAIPRDSSVVLPFTGYVPPARRVSAATFVGSQVVVPHEGAVSPPEAALSVGGGYGRRPPVATSNSRPALVVSPVGSTDPSQYSDSEAESPPPAPQRPQPSPPLPVLQPTRPLRFGRVPGTSSEYRLLDPPRTSSVPRALPIPPSQPSGLRSPSVYSQASSAVWTHSYQGSSSSSFSGYR